MSEAAVSTPPQRATRRLPILAIVTLCTLWGLWSAQQSVLLTIVSGRSVDSWLRPLGLQMSTAAFWAVITPLIMITTRLIRDRVHRRALWVATHVAVFLIIHVIDSAVYSIFTSLFSPTPRPFIQLVLSLTTFNMVTYGMIAVITTALDYQDALRERGVREARLEAQLASAQFQALRAQLHPHFLFNALNAISALIHKDADRAERMLARLSELLRLAIDSATTPEVRLAEEIEFVKRYLEIERMRFGDRLAVNVAIAPETHDALVPNMLLQPLVENAVRHGVAPHSKPGRVELRAERTGSTLDIIVSDSGPGMTAETLPNGSRRDGVGLRATRERLAQLYGSSHTFVLSNVPGGFEARVSLPFRRSATAQL